MRRGIVRPLPHSFTSINNCFIVIKQHHLFELIAAGKMNGSIQVLDVDTKVDHILTNVGQGPAMDAINLYEAKTHLSELVERAAKGEEIIIAKAGRALARLVPLAKRTTPRPLGLLAGQVSVAPDFDDPLPDEILQGFK